MGWIPSAAVAAASAASVAGLSQRLARVPAWPLLLWLLAAQLPRAWAPRAAVAAGGCLATAWAVWPSTPWLAAVWAAAAALQVLFRDKPTVEFELM